MLFIQLAQKKSIEYASVLVLWLPQLHSIPHMGMEGLSLLLQGAVNAAPALRFL